MSQIKAQKLRLIFTSRSLKETLHDTLQLVELQAKRKEVELCLTIHPDIQDSLCTDHVRLSQIVLNLLNNAIKFTQKGSVRLSAQPADDPNCIKISVQDSGIGMTQENLQKLFSDYTHIEFKERASINPTGVGLGLSIAYNLAKLLGPQGITVESVLGHGSTFNFIVENKEDQLEPKDLLVLKKTLEKSREVPNELQDEEQNISLRISKFSSESTSKPLLNESKCSCAKILVVDDNPFNIMALETVLESLHFKCDSVFDGQAAIDKILNKQNICCHQPYSVIFMDQEMPGLTGSETVCEIRRLQNQNLISPMKIIGCTAHGSSEEINKFMKSGLDMCIQKPIISSNLQKIFKDCPELL
jgi:CheY-like chemotaxis protein